MGVRYQGEPWSRRVRLLGAAAAPVAKKYLYVGGTTNQKVWKIDPEDMSKVAESAAYGGNIATLASDGTYIYCAGATTGKVWKIDPADMSKVAESAAYGGNIATVMCLGGYVYCGGRVTNKIWKIDPSDMSKVGELSYGGWVDSLASDGSYVYCGGDTVKKVWKIDPTDMSKIAESAALGSRVWALAWNGENIFAGRGTYVSKIDPVDMSVDDASSTYNSNVLSISADDAYVYIAGRYFIRKLNADTLDTVTDLNYGPDIETLTYCVALDGSLLYCGGDTNKKVWKIDPEDMSKVAESASYGGNIYAICVS